MSTPRGACWRRGRKGRSAAPKILGVWVVGCVLLDRCPDGGTAPGWGVGHLFAALRRHGVLRRRLWWARSISGATTPSAVGGHDLHDLRPPPLVGLMPPIGLPPAAEPGCRGRGCDGHAARRRPG